MGDRHFKRIMRRYKKRFSRLRVAYYANTWRCRIATKKKAHYSRETKPLSVPAMIGRAGRQGWRHENHKICSLHPRSRWLECPHGLWCGLYCMGCHGTRCPYCNRQMKVKRRFKNQT